MLKGRAQWPKLRRDELKAAEPAEGEGAQAAPAPGALILTAVGTLREVDVAHSVFGDAGLGNR